MLRSKDFFFHIFISKKYLKWQPIELVGITTITHQQAMDKNFQGKYFFKKTLPKNIDRQQTADKFERFPLEFS